MNKPTITYRDNKALGKILGGVNRIYEDVRRTMGPQGGNALIYGLYSRPYRITNDGDTLSGINEIKDPAEKLAASAIQDASKRTNLLAGDATSATTTVSGSLANIVIPKIIQMGETADFEKALVKKGKKQGVMDIKRELLDTKDKVIASLKKSSKEVKTLEELQNLAVTSVEHEEYGKTIAEMSWKVGTAGYIDILEGFGGKIETELIEGSRFPAKIPAKVFINKLEKYEMEIEDTPVLLTNFVIDKAMMGVFLGKLEKLHKLVIIAPNFKEDALVTMAQINKKNSTLVYAPVKCPSLKTVQFQDIEVFTGAKFINKDEKDSLANISNADLGFLTKLVVKDADVREDCIAIGGRGFQKKTIDTGKGKIQEKTSPVEQRIETLKKQLENTRESGQKELLRRRIAGLASAVGIIRVSADSEGETYYWKKKIEDAVCACRSALQEGYVKGGGLALKEIAEKLPEDNLLRPALIAPYEQIQENAGGIDIGDDVIDSTKAIRCAVKHSVSVIANLATVKIIVAEERDRTPAEGYTDIANAINRYVLLLAQEKGIMMENEEEIRRDTMANHDARLRNIID